MIASEQLKNFHDGLVFEVASQIVPNPKRALPLTHLSRLPIEAQILVQNFKDIVKEVTGHAYKISGLEVSNSPKIAAGVKKSIFSSDAKLFINSGLLAGGDSEMLKAVLYHEAGHLTVVPKAASLLAKFALPASFFLSFGMCGATVIGNQGPNMMIAAMPVFMGAIILESIIRNFMERECDNIAVAKTPEGMRRLMLDLYREKGARAASSSLGVLYSHPSTASRLAKAQKAIIQQRLSDKGQSMPPNPVWRAALSQRNYRFMR